MKIESGFSSALASPWYFILCSLLFVWHFPQKTIIFLHKTLIPICVNLETIFVSSCIGARGRARGGTDCRILLLNFRIFISSILYVIITFGVLEQEEELIVTLRWLRRDHPSWHSVASGTPAVSDQSGLLYFYQLSCGICIERWKIFVIITAGPQSDSSLCALVSYSKLASAWLLTIINLNWQIWAELNNSWCQVLTT